MKQRLLTTLLILAAPAAFASTTWSSDFEAGNTSAWSKMQAVSPDRMQIVSDPVKQGSKALKVTVNQGDDPVNCGNDRAELLYQTQEAPGSEYWYHFNVLFPADYPIADKWQLFTQWHQNGLNGSPPLEMYVVGNEMRLRANAQEPAIWHAPLEPGKWQDFVLHIKWSSDASVGFIELYRNGQLELPATHVANQFPGDTNYMKMGLYRARQIAPTASVYFDDVKMGTTKEDVMPAAVANGQAATPGTGGSPQAGATSALNDGQGPDNGQLATAAGAAAGGGCSVGGNAALPIGAAMGLLAMASMLRRRRATVTVPARTQKRS